MLRVFIVNVTCMLSKSKPKHGYVKRWTAVSNLSSVTNALWHSLSSTYIDHHTVDKAQLSQMNREKLRVNTNLLQTKADVQCNKSATAKLS